MWRLSIKIKGKRNNYIYRFEYFSDYDELLDYLKKHKPSKKVQYEALLIAMFENE